MIMVMIYGLVSIIVVVMVSSLGMNDSVCLLSCVVVWNMVISRLMMSDISNIGVFIIMVICMV